jgi:hypothetical protein
MAGGEFGNLEDMDEEQLEAALRMAGGNERFNQSHENESSEAAMRREDQQYLEEGEPEEPNYDEEDDDPRRAATGRVPGIDFENPIVAGNSAGGNKGGPASSNKK